MAVEKPSINPAHLLWEGGTQPLKAGYGKLMMWIFLLSDVFTFSGFLVVYGMIRFGAPSFKDIVPEMTHKTFEFSQLYWPIPEHVFKAVPFLHGINAPLVFVGIMTFILIFSSVTMVLAVEAGHRRDKADVEKWMLWTILGGFIFLASQAWEWNHFIHGTEQGLLLADGSKVFGAKLGINEYGPANFANLFFFITGFHGFHVFIGVLLNIMVYYNTANGVYEKRGHYEMIEKVGLYWHFVDLVWVFVFTFFYLV
jgi:cytochrome c oxidase subunit 3